MASSASRRALRTPPRSTRTKPRISYAEPSSDSDLEAEEDYSDDDNDNDNSPAPPISNRPRRNTKPRASTKRQRSSNPRSGDGLGSAPKRRKQSKRTSPRHITASSTDIDTIKTNGIIPPWQSLPYHIFVQIFQYATYPLYDDHTFQPLASGSWLLKIARLCRSFAEPAFTVLYASPPLVPMDKAHMLVDLLKRDPNTLAFKYRQKVESLRIDVGQVAAYSLPGSGHLDLFSFVKDLPRLFDLEFYHQKDMSPYRNLDDTIKWSYPESLFQALEYIDPNADPERGDKTSVCKLRSWRWSSRLAGKKYPIESIREMHLKPSFASLRKIAFVNYQIPLVRKGDEDPPKHENILADALSILPNLEHLIFESSTLVNAKLLPLLPKNLRNLELINCWEVIADDFAEFLLTHGSQLRCLTLNHNQSLSLSFLPVLGTACPKLEVFRMNLTYFNLHATYRDSEPQYEQLLLPSEVPVWPRTLQTIELIQLRKWETEAAEMFFQSLLDSAATLPDLRRLTIQAILNIGWRDRASFRDRWVGSLDRVFRRVSEPPRKHVSVAFEKDIPPEQLDERDDSNQLPPTSTLVTNRSRPKGSEAAPTRRSTRTSTRQAQTGKYTESPDHSSTEDNDPQPSQRQLTRQNRIQRELAILRETAGTDSPLASLSPPRSSSSSSSSDAQHAESDPGKKEQVIQGMCEVVDIRIDNLRPRETQATEADFLDEEAPGDGDWNGEDVVEEGYAW